MPELPDIEVFSKNLDKIYRGKRISKIRVVSGKKIVDKPSAFQKLKGDEVARIYRFGKEIRIQLSSGTILGIHLMLTGDLWPFEKKNARPSTIAELHFHDGSGLALTDWMKNANIKINPPDKKGIDALDKKLTWKKLKEILNSKANVKSVILNQDKILGIGNGYSDEILWRSRISPFSIANAIPEEKIKELAKNIRSTLKAAAAKIYKKYPGLIHGEVRDFMQIHSTKLTHSPTGAEIKVEKRGMLKTYYTDEQVLYQV